ncbi:hypothetical protein Zmor_011267 [Zophobas morio]|uniref:MULE transposase domain-containing protein n=1 Tax=Zophobas morio TaxID=2755281 RepID=A0AA38IR98_9CUCU|nr:hypothetical protein Zmor_011267 [Zophobas morio]
MHKLIHSLVLGAAHESLHETPRQAVPKKPKTKTFEQLIFLNTSIGSIGTRPGGPHKHNHSPEEEFLNDLKYRQKLRQRASVENIPLSTIYNQEQEVSPQLALSTRPYNGTVRKMMERARKKNLPKVPRSIQEIDNFIRDERAKKFRVEMGPEERPFYGGLLEVRIQNTVQRSIYFISPTVKKIAATKNNCVLQMDGTFSVVPKAVGIKQLFCVHLLYSGHVFPIMYCLMERRTTAAYEQILETLKNIVLPNKTVKKIMTDYEASLRKALGKVFPEAQLLGCWFHFAKAVHKKAMKLGLGRQNVNRSIKEGSRMAMALPLLPEMSFEEGIEAIYGWMESHIDTEDEKKQMNLLCSYLRRWRNQNVSVYGQEFRTNNAVESFHSTLVQMIGNPHVSFWRFIESLRKVEHKKACDAIRVHRGEYITMSRGQKLKRIQAALDKEKQRFDNDEDRDIGLFLRKISNIMKGEFDQCQVEEEMNQEKTEIDTINGQKTVEEIENTRFKEMEL